VSYLISEICSHTAAQPLQVAFLRPTLGLIGQKKGALAPGGIAQLQEQVRILEAIIRRGARA
jgi:hypothetical protein